MFDCIDSGNSDWLSKTIAPLNNQEIELETEHLFKEQWNTAPIKEGENGLRVHDWYQAIYPNLDIKCGYYLEQTEEMVVIKHDTYRCNYCNKNYYRPFDQSKEWCECCLGSEYLQEDQLYMLYLTPIYFDSAKGDVLVPQWIKEKHIEELKKTRERILEKRKIAKLESIKNDIASHKKEYIAFKWLIDRNIDFENVIYYSHSKKFSFGWRKSLSTDEKETLKIKLEGFPYEWEFHKS